MTEGINDTDLRFLSCPKSDCDWASELYHKDNITFAWKNYRNHFMAKHLPAANLCSPDV